MIGRFLSEYRVHLVGLLIFGWLLRAWRSGDLDERSAWILGFTALVDLLIWAFFRHQFSEFAEDVALHRARA